MIRKVIPDNTPELENIDDLIAQIRNNGIIVWAGAGLSKPLGYPLSKDILCDLFFDLIKEGYHEHLTQNPSLKEISQHYEDIFGRDNLVEKLFTHFQIKDNQSAIHKKISQIPQIKHIITTNYDELFEISYAELNPIVLRSDEDYQLLPRLSKTVIIYKIHGDFIKPEKIVITSNDYSNFDYNSILWSNIRYISAQYSILFLGYSIGDDNVIKMIIDIQERLKENIPDMFIVSKNPRYYNNYSTLFKKPLKVIPCSIEEVLQKIEDEVIRNSLFDNLDGKLSDTDFSSILGIKNLDFSKETDYYSGRTHISLIPKKPNDTIKASYSLRVRNHSKDFQRFLDLLNGKHFEEVMLDFKENNVDYSASVEGIQIISKSNGKEEKTFSIKPIPTYEYQASFKLSDNSYEIDDIKVEHYINQETGIFKINYSHPAFSMEIKSNDNYNTLSVNITLSLVVKNINHGYNAFNLLEQWFTGKDLIIMTERFGTYSLPSYCLTSNNIRETKRTLHFFAQLYSDIKELQDYFNRYFSIPDQITLNHVKMINDAVKIIRGENFTLRRVSATISKEKVKEHWKLLSTLGTLRVTLNDFKLKIFNDEILFPMDIIGVNIQIANIKRIRNNIKKDIDPFIIFGTGRGTLTLQKPLYDSS